MILTQRGVGGTLLPMPISAEHNLGTGAGSRGRVDDWGALARHALWSAGLSPEALARGARGESDPFLLPLGLEAKGRRGNFVLLGGVVGADGDPANNRGQLGAVLRLMAAERSDEGGERHQSETEHGLPHQEQGRQRSKITLEEACVLVHASYLEL